MEVKQPSVQSLLLVDTYRPDYLDDNDVLIKNRAITLTSFRILNHLQSSIHSLTESIETKQKLRKDTGLKWSYKFFSSRSYKSAVKQDKLRDFKLRYFEQYEAKLEEKLQTSNEKVGKASKINPAECIQKALTELVTDIQWETPDIASPMKGRRHSRQQQHSENQNVIFLFTSLPSNSQEMRMFAGKRVLDSDILLDAIMPPHLFEQFCRHAKLSLFWIDISSLNTTSTPENCVGDPVEMKCIEIITSTLSRVGGSAFKIESLINMGHTDTWSLGKFSQPRGLPDSSKTLDADISKKSEINTNQNKQSNCVNLLPCLFSSDSIIESFSMFPRRQKDSEMTRTCPLAQLQLSVEGVVQYITLKLEPTSRTETNKEEEGQSRTPSVAVPPTDSNSRLVNLHLGMDPVSQTNVTILQSQPYDLLLTQSLQLAIHSCMSKSLSSLSSVVGASSFCASVNGQGETTCRKMFEDLLKELHDKNKILVLTMKSGGQACPHLALLDTLSCHSAILTVLPLGATLQVEKSCVSQIENSWAPPEGASTNSSYSLRKLNTACKQECSLVRARSSTGVAQSKHQQKASSSRSPSQCYNPQILNSWHLPGTSRGLPSLISKLNSRLEDLDFLTVQEKETLKALQKMYRKDNQPQALLQRSKPPTHLSQTETADMSSEDTAPPVSQSGKTRNSKLNRGMMMVNRSKAAVKRRSKTEDEVIASQVDNKTDRQYVNMTSLDLQTEESLGQYLNEVYTKTLDQGDGLETSVQNMVTVAVHFLKEKGDNPEIKAVDLLRREVVLSSSALREKYQDKSSEGEKTMKITEYKLQVLLLLEMESAVLSADDSHIERCVDEIVNLLRTLSFITDSSVVPDFLNKDILTSYAPTLPQLLVSVYDELMQPLPESLAMFASPNKSADSSVFNISLRSHDSMQDPGSQPGSNKSDILQSNRTLRNRRLVQHPSLSDYGSKKQIMVMKKPTAAKNKEKGKEKERIKKQKSMQPTSKPKKMKGKADIVKVRRNLFIGDQPKLERRQSVAVMERTRKSPHKKLTDASFRSPKATKSPGAKRRSVAETPAHKQMSNAVWMRMEKKRKRTSTEEDVEVVQESPMKQWEDNFKKVSPSRNKHAMNMMRRSFYSAGPRNRSRNLTKYFQFADKIAGRQQRLSLGDVSGSQPRQQLPHKSPSRSSFLMSQLMGSPSPRHKTPSKTSRSATATTPKHTVQESPFRNTRSKTPKKFSKVLMFDSPKKSSLTAVDESSKVTDSPSKHHHTPRKQIRGHVNILCEESPVRITRSHTPNKMRLSPPSQEQNAENLFSGPTHSIQIPSTPKRTPYKPTSTESILSPPPAPPLTPQRSILKSSQSSTTKKLFELPSTPQRTPKLSHKLVSESPSQNTRSKNNTPSRMSVCTALFSPSGKATPRGKLFSGLELSRETRSPKRRVHFDDVEDTNVSQTENSSLKKGDKDKTDPHTPQKMPMESLTNVTIMNKDGSVTSLYMKASPSTSRCDSKSDEVQRTPSPQKQQKVRTPDSFDKWPRRKRRWASPTQPTGQKENLNAVGVEAESSQGANSITSETDQLQAQNPQELQRRISSISRKRSFLESIQDSSTTYSPNKRSKTSWTDSLPSKDLKDTSYYCLHQHVTSVSSVNEALPSSINSSQTSASALDYFSSTNDEVFLAGDSHDMHTISLDSSVVSTLSRPSSTRSQLHSAVRSGSPVFGTSTNLSRLIQNQALDPSPSSQGFEVNSDTEELVPSPKFQTSPVLTAAGNKSSKNVSSSHTTEHSVSQFVSPGHKSSRSGQISPSASTGLSTSPRVQKSPHPRTSSLAQSPQDRKFSPSVSARSLVHLMNSPLIKPDESPIQSPSKMRSISQRSHFKSRKSLNMQK